MRISFASLRLPFLTLALLLFTGSAEAQYFGRNKVQWESFNFKVLHTPHFDIHYYEAEKDSVEDVGRMAERWYERLSRVFGHSFSKKPIVLYANSADFHQTTTTGGLIGEGTGGFTDAFQNRVVLPLTGDNASDDHVIGHELVHVFQYDIARRISRNSSGVSGNRRFNLEQLPLWLIEGMAEYFSKGRVDPLTAMWIRDAANNNRLPDFKKLNRDPRYFPYRYGQALLAYVGGRYGDDNVVRLFLAAGVVGPEQAFARVLGEPVKDVFAAWHTSARELYEPVLTARPESLGAPLLAKKSTRGDLNVAPSLSPDGKWIAFLTTRELFSIDLFLADAQTGQIAGRLVSSEADPHYDALRFIDSSGGWSPDSKKLVFVVFEKGDNRLAIVDVGSRRIEQRIKVPGVDSITNPVWSPDGTTIAFSGQTSGVSDLFLFDLASGAVRRLTNDKYSDLQPAWSPDGRTLAFVTDRGVGTDLQKLFFAPLSLATIDIGSGTVRQLQLFAGARHINPQFAPNGNLYFIANPEGIADVYQTNLTSGVVSGVTRVPTGVSGITDLSPALSVASRTGEIAVSLFENDDYNIYRIAAPQQPGAAVSLTPVSGTPRASLLPPARAEAASFTSYLRRPDEALLPAVGSFTETKYDSSLHLSYLGPPTIGIGFDTSGQYGAGGTVSAYFTDVLGQHNVGFTLQGGGGSTQDFTNSFGGELFYLNQKNRIHWGGSATHFPTVQTFTASFRDFVDVNGQQVLADIVQQRREIQTFDEISGLTQYPLSLTRRLEASAGYQIIGFKTEIQQQIIVGGRIIDDTTEGVGDSESLGFIRGGVAYVGDSSFFGFISPIKGTRYRFEAETLSGDLNFQTALADYRKYFFARPVTMAVRGLHYGRYGSDAENGRLRDLFLGRSSLVRGYESDSFDASECIRPVGSNACPAYDRLFGSKVAIASTEVRVPLFGTKEFGLISAAFLPTELFGFADAGVAWTEDESPSLKFETDTIERVPVFSAGVGLRILLSYIPLEVYYAKPFQRPNEDWVFGFNIAPGW